MCDCITETNKALKKKGFELAVAILRTPVTGELKAVLPVPTRPVDPKSKKHITLIARYCPFCGEDQEQSNG